MIHYKHSTTGEVFAYASKEEREKWGDALLVEMTEEELHAHMNPPETEEQRVGKALNLLASTDWYVTRLMETGKPIPEEISAARAQAREVADK